MQVDFSFSRNTVGYIIEGVMDKTAIQNLKNQILEKFEEFDAINLYIEDNGIQSFTFNSVFIATLFPVEYSSRLSKVAVVTNRKWIHLLSSLDNLVTNTEIKNFTSEDRMDAMYWITKN